MNFSVLMSVYNGENYSYLSQALASIYENTIQPNEVVLVEDGALTDELCGVIELWRSRINIVSVRLPINVGLGEALNRGLEVCRNEIILRSDSDDINRKDRFEKTLNFFVQFPNVDILSGWIEEFHMSPGDCSRIRFVPERNKIKKFSRRKSPINHPASAFKKNSILSCGGYGREKLYEDYALWLKAIHNGYVLDNIQSVLVDMRTNYGLYERRGGVEYAISEFNEQWSFYRNEYLTFIEFLVNVSIRIPVRIVPTPLRRMIYQYILRMQ